MGIWAGPHEVQICNEQNRKGISRKALFWKHFHFVLICQRKIYSNKQDSNPGKSLSLILILNGLPLWISVFHITVSWHVLSPLPKGTIPLILSETWKPTASFALRATTRHFVGIWLFSRICLCACQTLNFWGGKRKGGKFIDTSSHLHTALFLIDFVEWKLTCGWEAQLYKATSKCKIGKVKKFFWVLPSIWVVPAPMRWQQWAAAARSPSLRSRNSDFTQGCSKADWNPSHTPWSWMHGENTRR